MEDVRIARNANPRRGTVCREGRLPERTCGILRYLLVITLALILVAVPVSAAVSNESEQPAGTAPELVTISAYVIDFNRVDVEAGTVGVDFYLNLKSDTPVSISDIELMNGAVTSVSTILDTPYEKEYRVVAIMTAEPDLRRYPFDRHMLTIKLEPKQKNEQEMLLIIDPAESGLYDDAQIPGWEFSGSRYAVTNESYLPGEVPTSRAVFGFGIERDVTSTLLKFFLPIMLIVMVSLSSLLMKVSSRLGLNASMFLAAVLIHWRVADELPAVAYATFLDLFMMITYATLVLVLISGILILKYMEDKDTIRIQKVNYWSLRLIPPVSIALYFLLFLMLVI
jgi:hypothetical protein